jgi:hypothetical protein
MVGTPVVETDDGLRMLLKGSTLVMYDYDHLRKGAMSEEFKDALEARIKPIDGR